MLRCMYSGISGMKNNQQKLDVIGNNLANVSTTAFKSSRAEFADMLYQNAGYASAPTMNKGGSNAKQIGLGAKLSSINRIMSQGNALSTGRSLDVCVDGEGYFIVAKGNTSFEAENPIAGNTLTGGANSIYYTRDGNFTLDKDGNLLTSNGYRIMGYLYTDANGNPSIDADGNGHYVNPDDADLKAVGEGAQLNTLRIPQTV